MKYTVSKLFQHLCCFQVISHHATYALLFETRLLPTSPCVALCCRSCRVPCTKANFKVSPTPMAKSANDAADRFWHLLKKPRSTTTVSCIHVLLFHRLQALTWTCKVQFADWKCQKMIKKMLENKPKGNICGQSVWCRAGPVQRPQLWSKTHWRHGTCRASCDSKYHRLTIINFRHKSPPS